MKKNYFLLFFSSLFFNVNSQITFNKLVHFEFLSTRFSAVFPTDSCFFLTADIVNPANRGAMFAKFDLSGNVMYNDTILDDERNFTNLFGGLIQNSDGHLLKPGIVTDTITRGVLYKYELSGDTTSTIEFNSILYPEINYLLPKTIIERQNGGYAVLIGHESIPNIDFDISLLLLDPDYEQTDYRIYQSSPMQETASSLILDDDGGYIIGADRTNKNQVSANFTYRTMIIKTDSLGEVVWTYFSPFGELRDEAVGMAKTSDGGLVVASGTGTEEMISPGSSHINWDALFFKLDSNQNEVWSTPMRGVFPWTQTKLVEMVASADGSGYVALGKVADGVSAAEPVPGTWLVKVSPEGDSLWSRYFSYLDGEYIDPIPYDLKQTPDGGYVAVGNTIKLGQPAPAWILKVDQHGCLIPGCHLTDATEEALPEIELAIYPNPTADYLNFQLRGGNANKNAAFRITDGQGRTVREFESASERATLIVPVWEWGAGVYFLQYMEEGEVLVSEKFVVVK